MATAKRKSSSKKAVVSNLLQQKWRSALTKLAQHKKEAESKIKALRRELEKKLNEAKAFAYAKGRADEAKENEKKSQSRHKIVQSAIAKIEKKHVKKKAPKRTAAKSKRVVAKAKPKAKTNNKKRAKQQKTVEAA